MSVGERDPFTGHMTTGHDWNGIKELNTRVPRVLLGFLAAAFLFAVGYWIMMPAWPLGDTYTKGALGFDQSEVLARQLEEARAERAVWQERFTSESAEAIRADEQLMAIVATTGDQLYGENCAGCHGREGHGGPYFPSLADDAWLWDNSPEAIAHTLRVGINSLHPESRVAQMPAFGQLGTLDATGIRQVSAYVGSLTSPTIGNGSRAVETLEVNAGARIYMTACVACHGPEGKGNQALGAPNLTDEAWIYGGDPESLYTTIDHGRAGHMPAWESRLSEAERMILAFYVRSLSDNAHTDDTMASRATTPATEPVAGQP